MVSLDETWSQPYRQTGLNLNFKLAIEKKDVYIM